MIRTLNVYLTVNIGRITIPIKIKNKHMKKYSIEEHRQGLILLYKNQVVESGKFMTEVLNEAIRKLQTEKIDPEKVEDWVVKLEKDFRTF